MLLFVQILMNVLEKVQAMSVSRDVSTIQEDSTAVALMGLNLSMKRNAKVIRWANFILLIIINFLLIIDFDECVGEGSGNECEYICVNYLGGFNCSCFDGFELVNNTQCQGIVESDNGVRSQ